MTFTGDGEQVPPRIVIRAEDLEETSDPFAGAQTSSLTGGPAGPVLPPIGPQPVPYAVSVGQTPDVLARLGSNTVVSGLVAGAIGGILGFFFAENIKNPAHITAESASGLRVQTALWTMIFGLLLGFVLMAWDGITSASPQKALRDGAVGAVIGGVAGFVGGYVAQWLYFKMTENLSYSDFLNGSWKSKVEVARTIGWAVLGGLLGAGVGIRGGPKKILNGLIGGVLGGALAGFIFEKLDESSTSGSGFTPRLIGLTLTGIGIGLGVGLVERLRRDSWITITGGPMAGKEFILYTAQSRVGRDYRCDIVMAKDGSVAPFHALFNRDTSGSVSVIAEPGAAITINGAASQGNRLRNNDVVGIGASALLYQERASRA